MKAKIERFIHSWVICVEDRDNLKLEPAIKSILRSIESELQKYKTSLSLSHNKFQESDSKFQDLIHFALQKAQELPRNLRFETFSYLNGGIQREVQRPEYQQLKQCFMKHLKPVPWSSYYVFIAIEVIPAILLLLIVASMPGLVLAVRRNQSSSVEDAVPQCTNILKIDYAQSHLALQNTKLQLSTIGIDHRVLPIEADFTVAENRRHADCFAHTLTQFCTDELDPLEEEKLLHTVASDDAYMEPLYLILTYAQNEPLRYKIIAKLAHVLYMDIQRASVFNSGRLIRILGQAIMAIHPDKLPGNITKDEIIRMSDMLSMYRRIAQSKSAVNEQILHLRKRVEIKPDITDSIAQEDSCFRREKGISIQPSFFSQGEPSNDSPEEVQIRSLKTA